MPLVLKDRVKETTSTTGTGAYTLDGAVSGFQSFSVIGNANTTYYTVTNNTDWEVGIGTYTASGTTLSRDTILESSTGGSAINWGAGNKDIFVTYPAERAMYVDGSSITPAVAATLPVTSGGTGLSTVTQGDIIYASASNTLVALPKNTTATRYLANTGTTNNPAWAQIDLSNGVTGDLPFANLTQIAGLSVLGVTGNTTADVAALTAGTDHQVLRRSGTALAFGSINLAQTAAVTGTLAAGNGGTGNAFFAVSGPATTVKTFTFPNANSTIVTTDATQTLTNKTVVERVSSTTSITSPLAFNSDNFDLYAATAQAANLTINADAGTPTDGRKIIFRFTCDGTIRTITFTGGASKAFKPVGVTLVVSGSNFTFDLIANKTTYFGCIYNTASARWEMVVITQEA